MRKTKESRIHLLSGLVAILLTLIPASGCGRANNEALQPFWNLPQTATTSGAVPGVPGLTVNPGLTRHGLGGVLKGTPVIAYDLAPGQVTGTLPAKVDLRSQMTPVADQGVLNSCCAFAIAKGLREYLFQREGRPFVPLSAGFLWYLGRKDMGYAPEANDGVYIEVGMKVLMNVGTDTERDFPYISPADQQDQAKVKAFLTKAPTPQQIRAAQPYRIGGIQPVNSLQAIRRTLASGYPVILGIFLYESFYRMGNDAVIPVPNPDKEKEAGSHIVAVAGYDDARKVLIIKNSWGPDWGDHGYFYLPYQFVKMGVARDAWTVKPF